MVDPCTYSYIGSGAWCSLNDNRAKSSPIYRPIFSKGNKNISVRLALWARTDLRNVLPGETGFCGLHKSNISAQCITRLLSPQGPCAIVKQIPLKKMTKKKKKMCTVFTFFSIQEYEKRYLNPFFLNIRKKIQNIKLQYIFTLDQHSVACHVFTKAFLYWRCTISNYTYLVLYADIQCISITVHSKNSHRHTPLRLVIRKR